MITKSTNGTDLSTSMRQDPGYDSRSFLLKTFHLFKSLFKQAQYSLTYFYHRSFSSNVHEYSKNIIWSKESQGLVVLIHGLRSNPAAWFTHISVIKNQNKKIDIFTPNIYKRGLCSLEDAAMPVLPILLDYTIQHPQKPVCIIGVSNGSRIAMWLETKLRIQSNCTPVKVSSISGIHFGSRRMDLLEKFHLAEWFYPNEIRKELKYGSQTSKELLDQIRTPLPENCGPRSYEFYASTEDLLVPDLDSSLPILNIGEKHHILHGHSHDSIVKAIAKEQISSCLSWISSKQITVKTNNS